MIRLSVLAAAFEWTWWRLTCVFMLLWGIVIQCFWFSGFVKINATKLFRNSLCTLLYGTDNIKWGFDFNYSRTFLFFQLLLFSPLVRFLTTLGTLEAISSHNFCSYYSLSEPIRIGGVLSGSRTGPRRALAPWSPAGSFGRLLLINHPYWDPEAP